MFGILIPVLIVAVIALVAGVGLSVASAVFAVPVNKTEKAVRDCLPGANCGACGFSGCDGYAAALAADAQTACNLCVPGGNDVAIEISALLGREAATVLPQVAAVMCRGNCENVGVKLDYAGVQSCKMAAQLFGGPKNCTYGCLGFGDCVAVCPYEAIFICDGVARINPDLCRVCKLCIKTCPRGLIELFPLDTTKAAVLCKNHDKGAQTRKDCTAGCIGCMQCVKACEIGAVTVDRFCATVDHTRCIGCGQCHAVCPVGCIDLLTLCKHS